MSGTEGGVPFHIVVERIAARFGRSEPRRRAAACLRGLLSRVEREDGWQLVEAAGDRMPDGVQEFLSRTRWNADAVRDDLQQHVVEQFGDADAGLVPDETGSLKEGTRSAGVKRQCSGTAGRTENDRISVFLGYASRHGRVLLDRAPYRPRDWAQDRLRRAYPLPGSPSTACKGFRCGLPVRRSAADPSDLTFYLTHAPEATTSDELVRIAG